jgi:hypothetical protein
VRLTVPDVLPTAVAYLRKPENRAGGALHVWLDDGNDSDAALEWCRTHAEQRGDTAGAELARQALRLTRTQRKRLARLAYHEAFGP